MTPKTKKKKVDFSVRPRAAKDELPPDADSWVRGEQGAAAEEPMKRLTHNLPTRIHTAFKTRCVLKGVTIQDRVQLLIERDLAEDEPPPPASPHPRPLSD
jgi:hypothetical protein